MMLDMQEIGIHAFDMLERITDGFFAVDKNWHFTYVNLEAARLLARNRDELLGKNLWNEFPAAVDLAFFVQYHKAFAEQSSVVFEEYFPPLQIWFEVRAYPSADGLSVFFLDVTEKKKRVSETEQHYESLFEHHPDAIYSIDLSGNYLSVNPSMLSLFGYTEDELLHSSFIPLVAGVDLQRTSHHFEQAAKGIPQNYEVAAVHKSGRLIYVNVTNIPIIIDGQIVGVYGICKDITQQKALWDELLHTRALYRLISENAQDIITLTSRDGIIRFISPAGKYLLGYEAEEVIGNPAHEFWHPEDVAQLSRKGIFHSTDEDIFSCRVRHKNGHYVWFETKVKVIQNGLKEVEQVLGIGREISERKKAEDELNKTKEILNSIIHNNADAIWVMDLEDRVREINASFEAMFQWTSTEVIGHPLPIIPAFLQSAMEKVHNQIKKGKAVTGFETWRQRKDGQLVRVSTTLSPIRDADGTIIGISGVCRDISEKNLAEQQLKEMKDRLGSFIENHVDGIVMFNQDGTVRMVNNSFEKMFGYSASEVIGKTLLELGHIPKAQQDELLGDYRILQSGAFVRGRETIRIKKDGTIVDVLLSAFPIQDAEGNGNGWSVVLRDITEWKKAQEIFQNTEKLNMAGQLAAGIAHEIRNPITAIKGFIQLMKSGLAEKTRYYDIIASEIERVEVILSELLILAKPQSNKLEQSDIKLVLSQVIALLEPQAIMNNVRIHTEFDAQLTVLTCDANQLKQVFINYIKNSMEAMPGGGTITVQLKNPNPSQILVRFMDQGCGMSKELLKKLGEPFYTTKEKGTGLGFIVSKRMIESHNGFIHINSEVNKGTTIEVYLPA